MKAMASLLIFLIHQDPLSSKLLLLVDLAMGDLWNDGKLSAVISNMKCTAEPAGESNPLSESLDCDQDNWNKSNRDGIGARITVKVGTRTLVDEVRSGSSYGLKQ
jgi:hypothetical protein